VGNQRSLVPARQVIVPLGVLVVALAGMAYCHIKDVGMKFDEHVYYMAALFCANIAASIALALLAVWFAGRGSLESFRRTVTASVGLAVLTIGGFVWSRTVGFPQMADHIGEWDTLGITSLVFEGMIVAVGGALLLRLRGAGRRRLDPARATIVIGGLVALAVLAATPTAFSQEMSGPMHVGNMDEYPHWPAASLANRRKARRLHLRTNAAAKRYDTVREARRLGYRSDPRISSVSCPGLVHFRVGGVRFTGRFLDPRRPQALVFWCDSAHRYELAAAMYRGRRGRPPRTWGNILGWHRHTMNGTWMTHVWLTRRARPAFAQCAPFNALHAYSGISYEPYRPDVDGLDSPCSDAHRTASGSMPMP
jgi:hypothetical protein